MSGKMTKERLEKLPALNREIERISRRITALEDKNSKACRSVKALRTAREALESYTEKANEEAAELVQYIETIEDPGVREIFMLRYYDGIRSWQRIAFLVGEHYESYVRRKHNDYLQR